jgi:hypothetical protein
VTAKTCHYWMGHTPPARQQAIAELLLEMASESPLLEPSFESGAPDWRGVDCESVAAAVWMMRALIAGNVLARREGVTLFVPVNLAADPDGSRTAAALDVVRAAFRPSPRS